MRSILVSIPLACPLRLFHTTALDKEESMREPHWLKNAITTCVTVGVLLFGAAGRAELQPGEVLDTATWQQAKDAMPEAILRRFASGQHISKVITLPKPYSTAVGFANSPRPMKGSTRSTTRAC